MNLSIQSAIKKGEEILRKNNIDKPKIAAKEILQNLIKLSDEKIFLHKDEKIGIMKTKMFIKKIERHVRNEPLQYITKVAHFYSRRFYISKGTLIPRPETEILVEKILEETKGLKKISCLDMCSGSGCIGITLLLENTNFQEMFFADLSKSAIKCCNRNLEKFKVKNKCKVILSNFFSNIPKKKFDVICSNPPYVTNSEYIKLQEVIKNFEPKMALVSKNQGFMHYKQIANEGRKYLKENGQIFFEVGYNQANQVAALLNDLGYSSLVTYNDLNNIKRVISAVWKK